MDCFSYVAPFGNGGELLSLVESYTYCTFRLLDVFDHRYSVQRIVSLPY